MIKDELKEMFDFLVGLWPPGCNINEDEKRTLDRIEQLIEQSEKPSADEMMSLQNTLNLMGSATIEHINKKLIPEHRKIWQEKFPKDFKRITQLLQQRKETP